jgi:hypothetical protein
MILAHGVGALGGLPLERWQFAWGVAAIVVIAFFAVNASRRGAPDEAGGHPLPPALRPVLLVLSVLARVAGVVVYVGVVTAGLFGSEFPAASPTPIAVLITFWVGLQLLSMVLGDVWRVLSPFETLALAAAWMRARARHERLVPAAVRGDANHLFAVWVIAGFVWWELAYHSPTTPRLLAVMALTYGVAVLTMAAVRGRGWLRTGEGFAVLFGLFATLSPLAPDDGDGRLGLRSPRRGLAVLAVRRGTMTLLFVVLGAAVFDGLTRTRFWFDLTIERVGWGFTLVNTLGLAWTIGIVAVVYLGVTRVASWATGEEADASATRFVPVLVPLAAGFTVAHYFSVLVLEGQGFWFLASDPYAEGWDLFGTADGTVDFNLLSPAAIAWVQAAAIALGHVLGVVVTHDRAVAGLPPRPALVAQYVLLPMLVGSAVAAVALLLGT